MVAEIGTFVAVDIDETDPLSGYETRSYGDYIGLIVGKIPGGYNGGYNLVYCRGRVWQDFVSPEEIIPVSNL